MAADDTASDEASRSQVRLATSSGSITVVAEQRDDVEVTADGVVERRAGGSEEPIVVPKSAAVEVRCPTGTDVFAGTSSGSVQLSGALGAVRVTTDSGSISAGEVASADLRSGSGDIEVRRCTGTCRASTTSGSVRVRDAALAEISGGSGDVEVSSVTARVRTVSGSVELAASGDSSLETVSGQVTITVPHGTRPRVSAGGSSDRRVEVEEGDDCTIAVRSVSGSVTVRSR